MNVTGSNSKSGGDIYTPRNSSRDADGEYVDINGNNSHCVTTARSTSSVNSSNRTSRDNDCNKLVLNVVCNGRNPLRKYIDKCVDHVVKVRARLLGIPLEVACEDLKTIGISSISSSSIRKDIDATSDEFENKASDDFSRERVCVEIVGTNINSINKAISIGEIFKNIIIDKCVMTFKLVSYHPELINLYPVAWQTSNIRRQRPSIKITITLVPLR